MGDFLPMLGVYKNDSSGGTTKVQLPSTKNGNLPLEVPKGGYSTEDYQKLQ